MNLHAGTAHLFKYFMAIALSLLLCESTFPQSTENQQMVFEGSLTDDNGNTISLAGAELYFYISANGCYLYGESSSVAGDSQGNILHRFGNGSIDAGSPNSFSQNLFVGSVTGTTTFAGNDCNVTPSDTRLAQVYYSAQNIFATIELGSVPYSHNALLLNGKSSADFVQVSADTNTLFNDGMSGQFLSKSASGTLTWVSSPSFSGDISTAAGSSTTTLQSLQGITLSATSPIAGQVLSFNGSAWTPSNVMLTSDVLGVLPIANGGSKWSAHANGIYTVSNTAIGTASVLANTKLYVEANTSGQVAKFKNMSTGGYGVRIDVSNSDPTYYALNVNNNNGSMFMVQNDGNIGIGIMSPSAHLHIASGSTTQPPLKIASGTLQSTPTPGSVEYDGSFLYITPDTNVRRTIATGSTNNSIDNINSINAPGNLTLNALGNVGIGTAATAHVTVTSNGNVGIGTTTPTTVLTVSGTIRTTASIEFADGTSQTTAPFSTLERVSIDCSSASSCSISCNAGKKILSGGCSNSGTAPIVTSAPTSDTQWSCSWGSGVFTNVTAYAVCVKM